MGYLAISFIFFFLGYKANQIVNTFRLMRDKKYIDKVVNKMFDVEVKKND